MDLIAFDTSTPNIPEMHAKADVKKKGDFESIWTSVDDTSGARGWAYTSVTSVVKSLQAWAPPHHVEVLPAHTPPFIGTDISSILYQ